MEIKLSLQTVTPLFLGGSNPKGEPELRAPSFRGVMRFWLRALLGGILGDNPQEIFKHESAVFGSTEHASPVIVRVQHQSLQFTTYSQLTANKPGLAYLLFSARATRSEPERKAIQGKFGLTCQSRSGTQSVLPFESAYASLWLLTHFGGIGSRSRRGGGNLQVQSVQGNVPSSLPPLQVEAKTPKELQQELAHGLKQLRQWAAKAFNGSLQPNFSGQPEFDVLHPNYCRIWVVDKSFNTWDGALNEFGSVMQRFRQRRQPDYQNVKSVIQGGRNLQPVKRAAFGLPIVFFFQSLYQRYLQELQGKGLDKREAQRRAREMASADLEGTEHDRRASPLIIRVVKLANEKYALVLLRFVTPLLPAGERLKLRHRGREFLTAQPDDAIWQELMKHLEQYLGSLSEVVGW